MNRSSSRRASSTRKSRSQSVDKPLSSHQSFREVKAADWGSRYGSMGVRTSVYRAGPVNTVESQRDGEGDGALPRRIVTRRATNSGPSGGYGSVDYRRSLAMDRGENWGSNARQKKIKVVRREIEVDGDEEDMTRGMGMDPNGMDPYAMMMMPMPVYDPEDQVMPVYVFGAPETAVYDDGMGMVSEYGNDGYQQQMQYAGQMQYPGQMQFPGQVPYEGEVPYEGQMPYGPQYTQ